jgi:hypothetical protein
MKKYILFVKYCVNKNTENGKTKKAQQKSPNQITKREF